MSKSTLVYLGWLQFILCRLQGKEHILFSSCSTVDFPIYAPTANQEIIMWRAAAMFQNLYKRVVLLSLTSCSQSKWKVVSGIWEWLRVIAEKCATRRQAHWGRMIFPSKHFFSCFKKISVCFLQPKLLFRWRVHWVTVTAGNMKKTQAWKLKSNKSWQCLSIGLLKFFSMQF